MKIKEFLHKLPLAIDACYDQVGEKSSYSASDAALIIKGSTIVILNTFDINISNYSQFESRLDKLIKIKMVMMKGFDLSKFDLFLFNYVCVVLEAAGVVGPFFMLQTILFSFPKGVVLSAR